MRGQYSHRMRRVDRAAACGRFCPGIGASRGPLHFALPPGAITKSHPGASRPGARRWAQGACHAPGPVGGGPARRGACAPRAFLNPAALQRRRVIGHADGRPFPGRAPARPGPGHAGGTEERGWGAWAAAMALPFSPGSGMQGHGGGGRRRGESTASSPRQRACAPAVCASSLHPQDHRRSTGRSYAARRPWVRTLPRIRARRSFWRWPFPAFPQGAGLLRRGGRRDPGGSFGI